MSILKSLNSALTLIESVRGEAQIEQVARSARLSSLIDHLFLEQENVISHVQARFLDLTSLVERQMTLEAERHERLLSDFTTLYSRLSGEPVELSQPDHLEKEILNARSEHTPIEDGRPATDDPLGDGAPGSASARHPLDALRPRGGEADPEGEGGTYEPAADH